MAIAKNRMKPNIIDMNRVLTRVDKLLVNMLNSRYFIYWCIAHHVGDHSDLYYTVKSD